MDNELVAQARFLGDLHSVERAQPDGTILVDAILFGHSSVNLVSNGEVLLIDVTSSPAAIRALLRAPNPAVLPVIELTSVDTWARWAQLHFNLGATGGSMADMVPGIHYVSITLIDEDARIEVADSNVRGTVTIPLNTTGVDAGIGLDLAELFMERDSSMLFSPP